MQHGWRVVVCVCSVIALAGGAAALVGRGDRPQDAAARGGAAAPSDGGDDATDPAPSHVRGAPRVPRVRAQSAAEPNAGADAGGPAPSSSGPADAARSGPSGTDESIAARAPVAGSPPAVSGSASQSAVPSHARSVAPRGRPFPSEGSRDLPGTSLRVGALLRRPSRGLSSEEGASPAVVEIVLSGPAPHDVTLRVAVDPPGAFTEPRGGSAQIAAGRDLGIVRTAALAPGAATLVVTPLDASGAATEVRLEVPLRAASLGDEAHPELRIVAGPPREDGPGRVLLGDAGIEGLAGAEAGVIRVLRSRFRGFDTETTEVSVDVDDPGGVLACTLPRSVTIAPGAAASAPLRVAFTERAGTATLRVRAEGAETAAPLRAHRGRWRPRGAVVLPVGARAELECDFDPPVRRAPAARADTADAAIAAVTVPVPEESAPRAEVTRAHRVHVVAGAPGGTAVRLAADGFDPAEFPVTVVPNEVRVGGDGVHVAAIPTGRTGDVVLTAMNGAVWRVEPSAPLPPGVRGVRGDGSSALRITIDRGAADPDSAQIGARLEPADRPDVRVDDGLHFPRRTPYRIGGL